MLGEFGHPVKQHSGGEDRTSVGSIDQVLRRVVEVLNADVDALPSAGSLQCTHVFRDVLVIEGEVDRTPRRTSH
jgi:hypothetical protein